MNINAENYTQSSSPDTHMNKSARAYDLMTPNLMDSEGESDSESDSVSVEVVGMNLKHCLEPASNVTYYMKVNEIGSEKVNPKNDYSLTTMRWNENIIPSNDRKLCFNPERVQLKDHQPSGRALSENIWKEGIRIKTNSRFRKHASSDTN